MQAIKHYVPLRLPAPLHMGRGDSSQLLLQPFGPGWERHEPVQVMQQELPGGGQRAALLMAFIVVSGCCSRAWMLATAAPRSLFLGVRLSGIKSGRGDSR